MLTWMAWALAADTRAVEAEMNAALLGWGSANLVGGLAVGLGPSDDRLRSAALGSAAWNTVNVALAIGGLAGSREPSPSLEAQARRQRNLERVLGINLALDGVYIGSGAALWAATDRPDAQGLGQALIVQGASLALFDATYLLRLRHLRRRTPTP